jgi:hypothetical protein
MAEQGSKHQRNLTSRPFPVAISLCVIAAFFSLVLVFLAPAEEPEATLSSQSSSVNSPVAAETEPTVSTETSEGKHALDPVLELANNALVAMRSEIRDYTATLLKRERIGGSLSGESEMELKVINPSAATDSAAAVPMHVYLKFNSPSSSKGREVIWIEGTNNNQLIAHEGGFKNFLRMNLDPEGTIAMMGNRYPITGIGMIRLVEKLIEKGSRDRELGPCIVQIIENEKVGDRPCRLIQVTHPKLEKGMDFHIAQIFFDTERMIPLRYAAFGWPKKEGDAPPLEEEYTYLNVKLNVGLTAEDFNPDNPKYNYP